MTCRIHINITTSFAWWTQPYIRLVKLADWLGFAVDLDRVEQTIMSGVRIYADGRRVK